MILKGAQRAGAGQLAAHLLNDRDNDHIALMELKGFVASDLHGALREAEAISKGTQCTQYLFSLSLNPPGDNCGTEQDFREAAERAERVLGLTGQPRAIIIHEKEGRRHAHAVWSRIDADALKAIPMAHFKRKLTDLSRDLYLDHGWVLPKGLQSDRGRNPLSFSLAEWQQAKRTGRDAREIKQIFVEAWARSDGLKALGNALAERGFYLAKGDRRGFVALDLDGNIYSLARWAGVKTKQVQERLGSPEALPSVAERQAELKRTVSAQLRGYISEVKAKQARDREPLLEAKTAMVAQQRTERQKLKDGQTQRWQHESQARTNRLRGGLGGLFDRLTGRTKAAQDTNAKEAWQGLKRDQDQRDALIEAQLADRQELQRQFEALRAKHAEDRKVLARDIAAALRRMRDVSEPTGRSPPRDPATDRERRRSRGPDLSL